MQAEDPPKAARNGARCPANAGANTGARRGRGVKYAILAGLLATLVVIPYFVLGQEFHLLSRDLMTSQASRFGVAVAGLALLAADIVLPVPSSVMISLMGSLLGIVVATVVGAAGLSLGCAMGYLLGRNLGRAFAERQMGREDFDYLSGLIDRHGAWALAACRPVPVLAEASVIAAGVAGVPAARTLGVTSLANIGVAAVYASIGASAEGTGGLIAAFMAALAVPALGLVAARLLRRDP